MKKAWCILLLLMASCCFSSQDIYQFQSQKQQQQFESLTNQFRCLVCQNQNIAESNAVLAEDLRVQIFQKIQKGESNQHIIDYLVARYGDYVLYRPPFNFITLGLWLGPFIFLLSGLAYLIYFIRKNTSISH